MEDGTVEMEAAVVAASLEEGAHPEAEEEVADYGRSRDGVGLQAL